MLLKLKKEQSVKLKISIIFIWLVALMILLNAIYDGYLMYIEEYEYPAFSYFSPSYSHYLFMGFGVFIAIGLLFKSKVARGFMLFFSYLPLFGSIYFLLIYGTMRDVPMYIFIFGMGFYVLTIYLFSHDEILKIYKVKHLKWEIAFYFLLSVIIYIFFTFYMKSITDDFSNESLFESNSSIESTELR
jgi:hypothetical protein